MKEVRIITIENGLEVDSKSMEVTSEMVGEEGTEVFAQIDVNLQIELVGGRPRDRK